MDEAAETPLIDLLRGVPADARMIYEHSSTHSQSIPVGRLCALAVAAIEAREADAQDAARYRKITKTFCLFWDDEQRNLIPILSADAARQAETPLVEPASLPMEE